jgi:hypothetical protein
MPRFWISERKIGGIGRKATLPCTPIGFARERSRLALDSILKSVFNIRVKARAKENTYMWVSV